MPSWTPELASTEVPFELPVLVVLAATMFLPLTVLAVVVLAEWLALLALLPLVVLLRTAFRTPWVVVARRRGGRWPRERYAISVRGWRPSRELIAAIREDIQRYGVPRSLGPPDLDAAPVSPAGPDADAPTPAEALSRLRAGAAVTRPGSVHGFASPFADRGWLTGYLRLDARSLTLGQDPDVEVGRRDLSVRGCRDVEIGEPTPDEAAVLEDGHTVVRFTTVDGRRFAVAALDGEALDWLAQAWADGGTGPSPR